MTGLPDSKWVDALNKIHPKVSGGVAVAAAVVYGLWASGVKPFDEMGAGWLIPIGVVGILGASLLLAHATRAYWRHRKYDAPLNPSRRFRRLSEQQQRYLLQIFRQGSRQFKASRTHQRWFEELVNWRFVELERRAAPYSDADDVYAITEAAWRQLERDNRRGKLPDQEPVPR